MKKIAIVHPKMNEVGGSEARPLWTAQALKDDYDITIITMGELDLDKFNKIHGTSLKEDEVKVIGLPIPKLFENRFDALRDYRLHRYCKSHKDNFDLFISTYNVVDFGKKGIQCIADFSFDDDIRREVDPSEDSGLKKLTYQKSILREAYMAFSKFMKGTTQTGWQENVTVVNSDWSGRLMKKYFGLESVTLYPSVQTDFPSVIWEEKRSDFISLGRISEEKKQDKLIHIISKVRKSVNADLHIVGPVPDTKYANKLIKMAEENSSWLTLVGGLYGDNKLDFLTRFKYAIHGRDNEAFGIAVAELVKAGCIVWVPEGGGQVEIVNHPMLTYKDEADAVKKITQVLSSEALQDELRQHLHAQAQLFSSDRFMLEMKKIVDNFFKKNR